jgi:ubiquinol-cytochrome c reductase cytochrome b subunit
MVLFAWPWLEARYTRDREPHNLLDRPRDRPLRTAVGTGALAFYAILQLAASNDLVAKKLQVSVEAVTWFFRIAVLVLPPLIGWVMYRLMRRLKTSGADRLMDVPTSAEAGETHS